MLEFVLDWYLIYRDPKLAAVLFPERSSPEDQTIKKDPTGVNVFIEVRNPAMPDASLQRNEVQQAFAEYDRQTAINNFKVACVLGMIFDARRHSHGSAHVPGTGRLFLKLRFLSAVLIAVFLAILLTPLGRSITASRV